MLCYDSLWLSSCPSQRHNTFTINMVYNLNHILKNGLCCVQHSRCLWTPTFATGTDQTRTFEDGGSVYPINFIKLSLH